MLLTMSVLAITSREIFGAREKEPPPLPPKRKDSLYHRSEKNKAAMEEFTEDEWSCREEVNPEVSTMARRKAPPIPRVDYEAGCFIKTPAQGGDNDGGSLNEKTEDITTVILSKAHFKDNHGRHGWRVSNKENFAYYSPQEEKGLHGGVKRPKRMAPAPPRRASEMAPSLDVLRDVKQVNNVSRGAVGGEGLKVGEDLSRLQKNDSEGSLISNSSGKSIEHDRKGCPKVVKWKELWNSVKEGTGGSFKTGRRRARPDKDDDEQQFEKRFLPLFKPSSHFPPCHSKSPVKLTTFEKRST